MLSTARKSSLKSESMVNGAVCSKRKNVRFDLHTTTIKRFDSKDEPIAISTENSPIVSPILGPWHDAACDVDQMESCWFNDLSILPRLVDRNFIQSSHSHNDLEPADLDLDAASEGGAHLRENVCVGKWDLTECNSHRLVFPPTVDDGALNSVMADFLNGQDIKVSDIKQVNENQVLGELIVNNIMFEKSVEVKFSFNNWTNIHYISSSFVKSITSKYDQFKFEINLNRYKFFLQLKDLLNNKITIDLCCQYDVNGETYYDNNDYQNYTLTLVKQPEHTPRTVTARERLHVPSYTRGTVFSHSRTFSDDTDYFNRSPLKHLFHNDTCELIKKPATVNEVLNVDLDHEYAMRNAQILQNSLEERSMSSASDSSLASTTSSSTSLHSFKSDNLEATQSGRLPLGSISSSSSSAGSLTSDGSEELNFTKDYYQPQLSIAKDDPVFFNPTSFSYANPIFDNSSGTPYDEETESIATDTTFKNKSGSAESNRPMSPIARVSTDNSTDTLMLNSPNNSTASKTNDLRNMDYETLLHSYCFYTPPKLNGTTAASNIVPSSPSQRFF
ncbi:protein phosphatase regulator GAC1 KNAG_0M00990 [Huiozyma naganishii CBS 8797]|uniref:CBM21 domain-containing protein n=1 Tax=Huiozyma naganishii (strain ATCC MYA-139 / BCRC 22969 / CBS 8797 / KCTC 17520 / NBRC 10181 / NCYC 3082 / Yp74L-3) TaxID=1071383 RepID=J7S417_HUIN7|nr:hypothetical protein KNAG_0M00990 [Kazachstania naganishii CBS 8797]CCK72952.1 hypothetical protein KNAG_0M00990 [Kazachstania naganishii CBS 8797]